MESKPLRPSSKNGRRELTKAQNRETILVAARQVFAELGFAAASVRDVIRATPLASGTFYNYFKSKEEVYQALRDDEALAVRPRLREARATAATAQDFFAASFRAFFQYVADNRGETPSPGARFRMDSPEVLAGFAELHQDIEAAMARGLLPATDAQLLSAALTGVGFELAEQVKAGAGWRRAQLSPPRSLWAGCPRCRKPDQVSIVSWNWVRSTMRWPLGVTEITSTKRRFHTISSAH